MNYGLLATVAFLIFISAAILVCASCYVSGSISQEEREEAHHGQPDS